MNSQDFNLISIRGRAAYGLSCLKIYVETFYPMIDFSPVFNLACGITDSNKYIDESVMSYSEIIPEYLYEFDNYSAADFEYLSENQYNKFIQIIPKADEELNLLMHSIRDIVWEYCYVDMEPGAPESIKHVMTIIHILEQHELQLPDFQRFTAYTFHEYDGWGRFINREDYL